MLSKERSPAVGHLHILLTLYAHPILRAAVITAFRFGGALCSALFANLTPIIVRCAAADSLTGKEMRDGSPGELPQSCAEIAKRETSEESTEAQAHGIPKLARLPTRLRVSAFVSFVPSRCRHDPNRPFEFSIGLNALFGIYIQIALLKSM